MENTFKKKKKTIIKKIEINGNEWHRQFEIRLPANTKRVTAIMATVNIQYYDG